MIKLKLEHLDSLTKGSSSKAILSESYSILEINRKNYWSSAVIIILSIILAIMMGKSGDTVNVSRIAIESVNTVMMALFAVVFMGYAFFQALINDDLIIWMINTKAKKCEENVNKKSKEKNTTNKSNLEEANEYFASLMMLQGLAIFINLILIILLLNIPNDWILFKTTTLYNNLMAIFLLILYFYFNFKIIFEVKSFIFNLYQLFNAHAVAKVLKLLDEKSGDEK